MTRQPGKWERHVKSRPVVCQTGGSGALNAIRALQWQQMRLRGG
jgi:hypothetical protein